MLLRRHDARHGRAFGFAVKAVVTGGGGFVGGALIRRLRARGDDVVAIVRDPAKATALGELGCTLVAGDLGTMDATSLVEVMAGSSALFHLAGSYRVGIPESEHVAMFTANVVATRAMLDAGAAAGVARMVYASTANVLGDTRGQVVDETYRRPQPPAFLSYYDETKYMAHLAAEERIAGGMPVLIAMPSMVYGPGDRSQAGGVIRQAMSGRLSVLSGADLGGSFVHVDDVAEGMVLVHDRGNLGESYILSGEIATLGEVVRRAAAVAGQAPPRITTPTWLLRAVAPIAEIVGPILPGDEPNVAEMIRASNGVTYWVSPAKAQRDLGYAARDLEAGLRTLL
jgi:nucleoside-diphosphate-sugar epimerase